LVRVRAIGAAAVVTLLTAWPSVCLACPVCFDPKEPKRVAFLAATALLSLLPLGTFGAMVLFVRRQVRRAEGQEAGHLGA
jgi:hypothetical protein